jgi:hypothetical protein
MPIHATIVLDSGSFIPPRQGLLYKSCRVGYFQCHNSCPDMRIYADGEEVANNPVFKFGGGNRTIDVVQLNASGRGIVGVTRSPTIDQFLLVRSSLYGKVAPPINETSFDCILQFHTGHFRCSMVKNRYFKEINADGTITTAQRVDCGPIAHDVVACYELADQDELRLASNGEVLWTSRSLKDLKGRLDIEILADDTTALKYYRDSLGSRSCYWIPNQGQPPPTMEPPDSGP